MKVAIGVYAFIKVSDSDGTDGIATAVKSALKDFVRRYENNDTVAQEVMDNIQHQVSYGSETSGECLAAVWNLNGNELLLITAVICK